MNGILRIAAFYFDMVRLQRGLVIVAIAMVPYALLDATDRVSFVVIAGGLIAIGPALFGGITMRLLAGQKSLHLRPRGSLKLLLGSFAACLVAAALPTFIPMALALPFVSPDFLVDQFYGEPTPPPVYFFLQCWSVCSMVWIGMYLCLGQSWVMATWVPPIAIFTTNYASHLGTRFSGFGPFFDLMFLPAAAGLGWLAFGYRFLTGPRPGPASGLKGSSNSGDQHVRSVQSHASALRIMGGASPNPRSLRPLTGSIMLVGIMTFAALQSPREGQAGISKDFPFTAALLAISTWAVTLAAGSTFSRTARNLWLRVEGSRHEIFRHCERWTAEIAFKAALVAVLGFALITLIDGSSESARMLLQLTSLFCYLPAFMYLSICITRKFSLSDALLFLAIAAPAFAGQWYLISNYMIPWIAALMCLAGIAISCALRLLALRRWRVIDWFAIRGRTITS